MRLTNRAYNLIDAVAGFVAASGVIIGIYAPSLNGQAILGFSLWIVGVVGVLYAHGCKSAHQAR